MTNTKEDREFEAWFDSYSPQQNPADEAIRMGAIALDGIKDVKDSVENASQLAQEQFADYAIHHPLDTTLRKIEGHVVVIKWALVAIVLILLFKH